MKRKTRGGDPLAGAILRFSQRSPTHEVFARRVFPFLVEVICAIPERQLEEILIEENDAVLLLRLMQTPEALLWELEEHQP